MHTFTRAANFLLIMMLLGALMAITACSKTDENGQTVGQKVDKAIDKTNAGAAEAGRKMEDAAGRAGQKIDDMTAKAGDKMEQGAAKAETAMKDAAASAKEKAGEITTVVDDSAITASVKADLLKDAALSSQKVEVSTEKGEVTLKGKVASDAARKRAEQLAQAVAGVHKVHNQLEVGKV